MKKKVITVLFLSFVLSSILVTALAAGKFTVTQENFYVVDSYSIYGYAFARIENTGDKPSEYSAALLEIYDKEGDTLASDTYPSVYGQYLQPGEYTYLKQYEKIDNVDTYLDVDDYVLNVTGKSSSGHKTLRINCDTATYTPDLQVSHYRKSNRIEVSFTNNTDKTIFGLDVVMAVLDSEGNILAIENQNLFSGVGVNPGAAITIRADVSDDLRAAYERAGFVPDHVDAYAYVHIDEE